MPPGARWPRSTSRLPATPTRLASQREEPGLRGASEVRSYSGPRHALQGECPQQRLGECVCRQQRTEMNAAEMLGARRGRDGSEHVRTQADAGAGWAFRVQARLGLVESLAEVQIEF